MAQITMRRSYDAPAEVVWDVVSDHALYGTVAPNLASVEVLRDGGEGSGAPGDRGATGESGAAGDADDRDAAGRGGDRDAADHDADDRHAAGEGLVRRCVDVDGNEWTERCHRWDEGRGFAVAVDVADSDFHRRLFDRFEGSWSLADRGDDVLVTVQFEFEPKYGPLGRLLAKYFEYKAPSLVTPIFDGWAAAIEARREDGTDAEPEGSAVDERAAAEG